MSTLRGGFNFDQLRGASTAAANPPIVLPVAVQPRRIRGWTLLAHRHRWAAPEVVPDGGRPIDVQVQPRRTRGYLFRRPALEQVVPPQLNPPFPEFRTGQPHRGAAGCSGAVHDRRSCSRNRTRPTRSRLLSSRVGPGAGCSAGPYRRPLSRSKQSPPSRRSNRAAPAAGPSGGRSSRRRSPRRSTRPTRSRRSPNHDACRGMLARRGSRPTFIQGQQAPVPFIPAPTSQPRRVRGLLARRARAVESPVGQIIPLAPPTSARRARGFVRRARQPDRVLPQANPPIVHNPTAPRRVRGLLGRGAGRLRTVFPLSILPPGSRFLPGRVAPTEKRGQAAPAEKTAIVNPTERRTDA